MKHKPRIIFFDIETSPIETRTWSLWPKSISHDSIIRDWTVICGAWKELGKERIHAVWIDKPYKDKEVVKTLRDVLAGADAICGHNSDKFDVKKLNARIIFHGLKPLPNIPQIDTLKMVKKIAAFSSNRLDYLSKVLTGQGKVHVDYTLWLRVMAGDKKALKEMVDYNKIDVLRLEEIYLKLLPYAKTHPHIGAMMGENRNQSCPKCGSTNCKNNGLRYSAAGIPKQEIQCQDCYSFSRVLIQKP